MRYTIAFVLFCILACVITCAEEFLVDTDHNQVIQIRPDGHDWTSGERDTNNFLIVKITVPSNVVIATKNFVLQPGPGKFINYPFKVSETNAGVVTEREKVKIDRAKAKARNDAGSNVIFQLDLGNIVLLADDEHK